MNLRAFRNYILTLCHIYNERDETPKCHRVTRSYLVKILQLTVPIFSTQSPGTRDFGSNMTSSNL